MRFRLPWQRREAAPEEPEPLPQEPPAEQEEEAPKGLTHVLEWMPTGWASLEVDRGDGVWEVLWSSTLYIINARYQHAQEELQRTLIEAKEAQPAQAEGSPEWLRLQNVLEHFSKIEYRVREFGDEATELFPHSMGMERPLRSIMQQLIADGFPQDRLLLRELREGEA